MGPREDRQADDVRVLLEGRGDDLLRGLVQTCVDDFHAGVTQRVRDHFRPTVVPVKPGFGDDDTNLVFH